MKYSHSQFDAFHKTQPAETVRQHQLQITLQQHGKTKYRKGYCFVKRKSD